MVMLSGLFFTGNERKLLKLALNGRITLVLAETVIEETLEKIEEIFAGSASVEESRKLLKAMISNSIIIRIEEAKRFFASAKESIRDESDAPLLAACIHTKPYALVTGDKDFFNLKTKVDFKIMTARQFLEEFQVYSQ